MCPTDTWIELPPPSGVTSVNGITGAVTLAAGSGIMLTDVGNTITISNTEAGGSVTSVGLSLPTSVFTVTGSPVTTAGTLTGSFNVQSAGTVFAGPVSGSPAVPTFRAVSGTDIGGFTQGSVIFAGSTGNLTQDNPNFFWNDTTFSLGLSTATPASNTFIDAVNTSGSSKSIQLTGYGTGSTVGIKNRFARGTSSAPTASQLGDLLGYHSGEG